MSHRSDVRGTPRLLPHLLLTVLGATVAVAVGASQAPVFRSSSDTVPLYVTVADAAGRRVLGLTREDFAIFDNGAPQPVTLFDNAPQRLRLVALFDLSSSMTGNVPLLQRACQELVAHLAPADLVRVGSFGERITFSAFTRDVTALTAPLSAAIPPNAPTPLWRAVDRAMTEIRTASEGRPVVLILSDGRDSASTIGESFVTPAQVRDRAVQEDVMIYGVGIRSAPGPVFAGGIRSLADVLRPPMPDPGLGVLALDTGGGYFELDSRDDLSKTFANVVDELQRQYLLGFAPPARDGAVHKIEVRSRRTDLTLRARKTYVAPK